MFKKKKTNDKQLTNMVARLLILTKKKKKNIHCIVVQIFKFRKHFLLKVSTSGISFTLG